MCVHRRQGPAPGHCSWYQGSPDISATDTDPPQPHTRGCDGVCSGSVQGSGDCYYAIALRYVAIKELPGGWCGRWGSMSLSLINIATPFHFIEVNARHDAITPQESGVRSQDLHEPSHFHNVRMPTFILLVSLFFTPAISKIEDKTVLIKIYSWIRVYHSN